MSRRKREGSSANDPRTRLIKAGLDLFGRNSFDGVSARMLTSKARVNLAAIQYYFGSKQGLYLSVAEHIVEQINELYKPHIPRYQEALKDEGLSREDSLHLLCDLLEFMITGFLGRPETEKWLSFILREQLCPTEAFDILFNRFMRPLDRILVSLVARIMDMDPYEEEVKLRALAIRGEVLVFHISPTTVKRVLKWQTYEPENVDAIRSVITNNMRKIFSIAPNSSDTTPDAAKEE